MNDALRMGSDFSVEILATLWKRERNSVCMQIRRGEKEVKEGRG